MVKPNAGLSGDRGGAPGGRDAARTALAWQILSEVVDPEIPTVSIVDLGMIHAVWVAEEGVVVALMPTFLGCPALPIIRDQVISALTPLGSVRVEVVRHPAWTTERITAAGREKLAAAGFALPGAVADLTFTEWPPVPCPHCASRTTRLDSLFGPTPCRAIHYCGTCRQPFEQFKPV